ncbi:MAG: helix-turn-helix transcriptional regulator [Balneolaceae bacterium]
MPYFTDKELTERFEYYTLQVEDQLLKGEDFNTLVEKVPFAVHLNHSETLEIMHVNEKLTEVTGFHENEIQEMGIEYLENYLHPETLANISRFLPPLYSKMKMHEAFPFIQYVRQNKNDDFTPFITFTKSTIYCSDLVICLSLKPNDFEKMSPKMEQIVEMDQFKLKHFKRFQQLTNRELEILKFLAKGFKNAQIAEQLFISRQTVETHRKHINRKLEISSYRDLVKYALAFNLVEF